MGVFSSTYEVQVGTTVSRVIKDGDEPSAIKNGVLASLLGDDDLEDSIMDNILHSVGMQSERMYGYAKRSYTYGVPFSSLTSSINGKAIAFDVVKSLFGSNATLVYCNFGARNLLHTGWLELVASHGYSPTTNVLGTLSAAKGVPVYLKDMVVVVTEATLLEKENGSLALWGIPAKGGRIPGRIEAQLATAQYLEPSPYEVDSLALADYVRVTYVWQEAGNLALLEGSFTFEVTGDPANDYVHVKYLVDGVPGYWLYQFGSGTHPSLDALASRDYTDTGSFFPFAYFRYAKTSMAADTTSAAYKTSKKLVKYLGMDYAAVIDSIHENPGIADVEQAMLMMAVSANSTHALDRRYLFDFFSGVADNRKSLAAQEEAAPAMTQEVAFASILGKLYSGPDSNQTLNNMVKLETVGLYPLLTMEIGDARFKMSLSMGGISKRTKVGVLGPVGSYTASRGIEAIERTVKTVTGETVSNTVNYTAHYYRRQITATLYQEVAVLGLVTRFFVSGSYATIGDDLDVILLVPLDHGITEKYSVLDREILYARSLNFVFNSLVMVEVKWYQQDLFLTVLDGIGLVMLIYGMPEGLALMTASQLAKQALFMLLKRYLIGKAFQLLVKAVGVELAFLVAVAAAIAGGVDALRSGGLAGAPWAKELLMLANGLSQGVTATLQEAMQGLREDAEAFSLYADKKNQLLEDVNALNDTCVQFSPFVLFGEAPDEYFNRTVYSGNIGQTSIDAVYSYVDAALTLPKRSQTIGLDNNVT